MTARKHVERKEQPTQAEQDEAFKEMLNELGKSLDEAEKQQKSDKALNDLI